MAAGTVTVIGPYSLDDTAQMATDLTSEAGAIVKNITPIQDIKSGNMFFLVNTEA